VARFYNMGLGQGPTGAVTGRPGGLPFHAFMSTVVLPERDIVPLRSRWREDKVFLFGMIAAALFLAAAIVTALVFAMATAEQRNGPARGTPPVKTAPKK
jgi:type VI secretion system protein ImpL